MCYESSRIPVYDLGNVRVIKKNLVYIVGLPLDITDYELRSHEFFGQFGNIKKVIINLLKNNTACAYITYERDEEAELCIKMVDESLYNKRTVRCTFGTTKYCTYFLKNLAKNVDTSICAVSDCMYLHEMKPSKDILTKEELSKSKLHNFTPLNKNKELLGVKYDKFAFIEELTQFKNHKAYNPPKKIQFAPIDFFEQKDQQQEERNKLE